MDEVRYNNKYNKELKLNKQLPHVNNALKFADNKLPSLSYSDIFLNSFKNPVDEFNTDNEDSEDYEEQKEEPKKNLLYT